MGRCKTSCLLNCFNNNYQLFLQDSGGLEKGFLMFDSSGSEKDRFEASAVVLLLLLSSLN